MKCGYCKKEMGVIGYRPKTNSKRIGFENPFCPHCKKEFKGIMY